MARIFKRSQQSGAGGSPYWIAQFYDRSGRRHTRSTRCTDKKAAQARADEWERLAARSVHAPREQATLRNAVQWRLNELQTLVRAGRRSKSTFDFEATKLGHLIRIIGSETPLEQITPQVVDGYIHQRLDEGAPSTHTLDKELAALLRALKFARRFGHATAELETLKPLSWIVDYKPRTRALSPPEAVALLNSLSDKRRPHVAFLLVTGCRWGESLRAQPEDVDREAGLIWIRGTKTQRSSAAVPILPHVEALLEIADPPFEPWGNVRRDLRAACERAGIEPCSPNDLRRTAGHWLRQSGCDSTLVAEFLRHTTSRLVETTYGRLEGEALRGAMLRRIEPAEHGRSVSAADAQQNPAQMVRKKARGVNSESPENRAKPTKQGVSLVPRDRIELSTRGFSVRNHKAASGGDD